MTALAPRRCSMRRIERSERCTRFATSLMERRATRQSRRCCSASVHARRQRPCTPNWRTKRQQASRGLPDSATSFVTRALRAVPRTYRLALTRSRAALDQRKSRRGRLPSVKTLFMFGKHSGRTTGGSISGWCAKPLPVAPVLPEFLLPWSICFLPYRGGGQEEPRSRGCQLFVNYLQRATIESCPNMLDCGILARAIG